MDGSPMGIEMVDGARVRELLPMSACIDAMARTMTAISRGEVVPPQRLKADLPWADGQLLSMPGALEDPAVVGVKLVSLYPGNPERGLPAVQGVIVLFDPATGAATTLIDAAAMTAIRTAAASGAATKFLAREDARSLGLMGYGVQAETHLEAVLAVRPLERVLVWGRSLERARDFAQRQTERFGLAVEACAGAQEMVEQVDILCTLTHSRTPIIEAAWLQPGAHVNLVGAHTPDTREADSATMRRGRLFVEVLASALIEAGDLLIPIAEGAISAADIVGEIGQVILGEVPARKTPEDITVYKSLGNSTQDLAASHELCRRLQAETRGESP